MFLRRRSQVPFYWGFFNNNWDDDSLPSYFHYDTNDMVQIPSANVLEHADKYTIEVSLPGIEKESFKLRLDGNTLTIETGKDVKSEKGDCKYLKCEFEYTAFKRSFTLPKDADIDEISAIQNNGIVEIIIPRKRRENNINCREIAIKKID